MQSSQFGSSRKEIQRQINTWLLSHKNDKSALIPPSVYLVKKIACGARFDSRCFLYQCCTCGDHVYLKDTTAEPACPCCKLPREGNTFNITYFGIANYIR